MTVEIWENHLFIPTYEQPSDNTESQKRSKSPQCRCSRFGASGWTAYCEKIRDKKGIDFLCDITDRSPEDEAESKAALDKLCEIEQSYEDEDTEMLIRLIRARNHLWT